MFVCWCCCCFVFFALPNITISTNDPEITREGSSKPRLYVQVHFRSRKKVVSKQSDNSCNLCCESVSGATTLYVAVEPTELIENVHAKTPRNLQ